MPAEPARHAIHATAVAIGDRALLIRGASRAGKSRLALALIARSSPVRAIRLIGDDRILLHRSGDRLVARPHPRIAGFIERRGLGLVAVPWLAQAFVGGIVHLGVAGAPRAGPAPVSFTFSEKGAGSGFALRTPGNDDLAAFPHFALDEVNEVARADKVLVWWAGLSATWAPHRPEKAGAAPLSCTKH